MKQAYQGLTEKVERAPGEGLAQLLEVINVSEGELSVWMYRDYTRNNAWYSDREAAEVFYFLMPKEVWVNDWEMLKQSETETKLIPDIVLIPSFERAQFLSDLNAKDISYDIRENPAYEKVSLGPYQTYIKRTIYTEESKKRWKDLPERSDLGINAGMVWKVLLMLFGCISVAAIGYWILCFFRIEHGSTILKVMCAFSLGCIVVILALTLFGFAGIPLSWVCWMVVLLGGLITIKGVSSLYRKLRLNHGGTRDYMIVGLRLLYKRKCLKYRQLKIVNLVSLIISTVLISFVIWNIIVVCFSKPVDCFPGLWIHAIRAKLFYVYDSYGSWYYSSDGWAVTRQSYPVGFSLLGTYFTVISGGWHERAIWFLPAISNILSFIIFNSLLARRIPILFATIISSALFLSVWFSWLQVYFYPLSFMLLLMLVGFSMMAGWSVKRKSNSSLVLGSVILAAMALMKNEGFVLYLSLVAGLTIYLLLEKPAHKSAVATRDYMIGLGMKMLLYLSGILVLIPWVLTMLVFRPQDNTMHLAQVFSHTQDSLYLVISKTSKWLKMELFQISSSCYSGAYWTILLVVFLSGGYLILKRKLFTRQTAQVFLPMLLFLMLYLAFTYIAFLSSTMEPLEYHLIAIPRLWMPPSLILLLWIFYSGKTTVPQSK